MAKPFMPTEAHFAAWREFTRNKRRVEWIAGHLRCAVGDVCALLVQMAHWHEREAIHAQEVIQSLIDRKAA